MTATAASATTATVTLRIEMLLSATALGSCVAAVVEGAFAGYAGPVHSKG
jgi:chemotaxis receptor (MCP) glutamine deamidase CheD